MEASCNMGYIFLVIFVFILHSRFALVQYLKTKITRKIYPILHSAPCDNYYLFFIKFFGPDQIFFDDKVLENSAWNCTPNCTLYDFFSVTAGGNEIKWSLCCLNFFLNFLGLAILQNGKFPTFVDADIVNDIFDISCDKPVIMKLRKGLDKTGIVRVSFIWLRAKGK